MLAAILIPTIRAAMIRARVSAIALDLANLDAALNQFKEKYGNYPPDFSHRQILVRFVQKAWPRITANEMRIFLAIVDDNRWRIDQAEALVFWLGGFSEDPLHPFTGPNGPFARFIDTNNDGLPENPDELERNQNNVFFPFDNNRLTVDNQTPPTVVSVPYGSGLTHEFFTRLSIDETLLFGPGTTNDPFPVCLSRGTNLPIVYLEAQNYLNSAYSVSLFPGNVRAYLSDRQLLDVTKGFEWINPHSYQLITAGLDEDFGVDAADFKRFSSGFNYAPGDHDNITNFSGGTLEDAIP
jgi:type II secretory pathway pseudopilin PulG